MMHVERCIKFRSNDKCDGTFVVVSCTGLEDRVTLYSTVKTSRSFSLALLPSKLADTFLLLLHLISVGTFFPFCLMNKFYIFTSHGFCV